MFTDEEKTILFYALEAVQRSLYETDDGGLDYCDRLTLYTNEFNKNNLNYEQMMTKIDKLLDELC